MVDLESAGTPPPNHPAAPPRPTPHRPPFERAGSWVSWFGPGRLVVTALCVVIVAAGGFWLVRAPAPPAEATLPTATQSSLVGSSLVSSTPASTTESPTVEFDPTPPTTSGPIVVHVAGHVAAPGVYMLDEARRVDDAIDRAGGPSADADLDAVNLAQELFDGQRLYVPARGEVEPSELEVVTPPLAASVDAPELPAGPVDLNRATVDQLDTLPGVGPSTAQAIVDERERNGPFATVDELERVPGIGPAKLEALRGLVSV
jgi:competence protein ComEA